MLNSSFLQLIRIALGNAQRLEVVPSSDEWRKLMAMSSHQGVTGLVFSGVEALPKEQMPPIDVIMDWVAVVDYIERENRRLNRLCVKLCNDFEKDGMKVCVMKGQGMASLYPHPLRRSVGDVDLWMAGGEKRVMEYVGDKYKNVDYGEGGRHVSFVMDGIVVEVHHAPTVLYNPFHTRKLRNYFSSVEQEAWDARVALEGGDGSIVMPSHEQNLFVVLLHFFYHWVYEGIGMKQLIDYYWLVKATANPDMMAMRSRVVNRLHQVGVGSFLAAVMAVFKTLGMDESCMLCPPNEKLGKKLLDDILSVGIVTADDFLTGRYKDETLLQKFVRRCKRAVCVMSFAPSEVPFVTLRSIYCWVKRGGKS